MFMQNAWYVAAWGREVGRSLLARRICNLPMVFYRLEDGTAVALADRCCHRLLPLSHGRLEGDTLVCGYHGLTYDRTGQCVKVPSQERVSPQARVTSYPVVERHRFVWVWVGDPALADPSDVPDLHWNDDPAWTGDGDVMEVACDYRLLIDNLLDLSHETYVHPTSIGDHRLPSAPIKTSFDGDTVTVSRWVHDHEPAPFWAGLMRRARDYGGHCDRWQIARYVKPCSVVIDVGVAETGTGAPEGDRSKGINAMILNSITPATDTSCWYFWANARSFCLDDASLTADMKASITRIFGEDKVIVQAQQQAMLESPDYRMININLDAGSLRVRRMIEERSAAGA
jgi:vanillate O-demethylase monooxygenase subunit